MISALMWMLNITEDPILKTCSLRWCYTNFWSQSAFMKDLHIIDDILPLWEILQATAFNISAHIRGGLVCYKCRQKACTVLLLC